MPENAISVAEAAKDFLRVLARVESRHEPATLVRDGTPVAKLVPLPRPARTCEELARRWEAIDRLPSVEAEEFASDIEEARKNLLSVSSAWD